MTGREGLLQTRELSIQFGGIRAVDGIDFSVHAGEVVGLIGPNGAGKTTLLNLITGVYKPTSGAVFFDGTRIDGQAPHLIARSGIARTFQNIRLFQSLTVMEHAQLALGSASSHLKSAFQLKPVDYAGEATLMGTVEETLNRFGLWDQRTQVASGLSYGLQRRLEIVRALMLHPQLLLLDEPTAGMNEDEAVEVADLIRLLRNLGLGILLIEHNMPFVAHTCDRVVVINFGRHITTGLPEEVRRDPRVLEAYLGGDHDYS
jgi:branched-chain amino acid transport system ATP-binding protein